MGTSNSYAGQQGGALIPSWLGGGIQVVLTALKVSQRTEIQEMERDLCRRFPQHHQLGQLLYPFREINSKIPAKILRVLRNLGERPWKTRTRHRTLCFFVSWRCKAGR